MSGLTPPPATRYSCLIGSCPWHLDDSGVTIGPYVPGEDLPDPGEMLKAHIAVVESRIKAHLETHPLEEWAAEVSRLRSLLDAAAAVNRPDRTRVY